MVLFKLFLIILFITAIFVVVKFTLFLFKAVDEMEVEEVKKEINHKSELVDDINEYVSKNKDAIDNAQSNVIDEFIKN